MGGRKPTVSETVVREWEVIRDRRRSDGASLWRIASELASSSGHQTRTVYFYLNPQARARNRTKDLERHYRNKKLHRVRRERWRQRQPYNTTYFRLTDNPRKYLLAPAFTDQHRTTATLQDILVVARLTTSQNWRPRTIEKILKNYAGSEVNRARGPPYLVELEEGKWYYGDSPPEQDPLLLVLSPLQAILVWLNRLAARL